MDKRKIIVMLIVVLSISGLILYIGILSKEIDGFKTKAEQEKNRLPTIATEASTKTQIQYVPKETIVYKDLVTGKDVVAKEDTDVDLSVAPPSVSMKYNGNNYKLDGIVGENNKFEDGKLVGQVSTNATIDVTQIVNSEVNKRLKEDEKNVSLGGYLTNKGFVASVGVIKNKGNLEYKIIGKVPEVNEFYGAGLEIKF